MDPYLSITAEQITYIKENFDKLIVGVHNDEQVMTYKQKPIISYKDRLDILKQKTK